MKTTLPRPGKGRSVLNYLIAAAAIPAALHGSASAQTLLHRYSFATDATDSIGGANGTIVAPNGGGAASISSGLNLPGSGGGFGTSGYVSLPTGILTNTTSLTVECWFTQNAANTWATPWDFGNNGSQNFALIPRPGNNGNNMEVAFTPHGNEQDVQSTISFPNGSQQYVALTYNNTNLNGKLFYAGAQVAVTVLADNTYRPGAIGGAGGTTLNMLGNDVYGDPQFNGTIAEFRIWDGAISQRQIAASTILGPGTLVTSLTPTVASLSAGPNIVITGTEQATFSVQLSQTGTNVLPATSDATNWVSANTNVLTVNSNGFITGVGVGTTTVSAKVAGVSATTGSITVAAQTLQHRYSFVSDGTDSVGGANGTLVPPGSGGAATISNGLILPGSGGGNASGYLALPSGILVGDTSITVECWVTQNAANTWATPWDFGNSGAQNFELIAKPGNNGGNVEVAFSPNNNERDLQTPSAFPNGVQQYVTLTYNNSTLAARLYTNGVIDASTVLPDISYSPGSIGGVGGTTKNWLGNNVFGDPQFNGTISEFRIWNGAVSALYVAVSAAAGPGTVVNNLTPTAVTIGVPSTSIVGAQTEQASVTANFTSVNGVSVTGAATNWVSSNPAVLTVSSSGLITGVSGGSATVSATVGGVTGVSASITVQLTVPVITQQPVAQNLVVGQNATFTVAAVGGQLSYQWKKGGSAIAGATTTSFTITNLALTDAGNYSVTVTNALGSTNSVTVALNIANSILLHRYSFATDASDSVGTANGTIIAPNGGTAATISSGLTLPGGGGGGFSGYVAFPTGILTNTGSVTVECWATQNSANDWATIWDFATDGNHNFELCPVPAGGRNNGNMIVAFTPHGNEVDVNTALPYPSGSQQYTALTFNQNSLAANLYTNGVLNASAVMPDASYIPGTYGGAAGTTQNWLGNNTYGDAQFQGTIYEFRIWNGVVTPLYLAISAAAGPGVVVTNFTPTTIGVTVPSSTLIGGQTEQASAAGNFTAASGVSITTLITNWVSSNPSVLTVSSNGLVTAVATGSATVSGTFAGVTGTSATITVQASAPVITVQPVSSETLLTGASLVASVTVQGSAPFKYFWYFNNGATPISVSSSSTLTIPNIQASNAGNYTVVVSNAVGTTTSSALALSIVAPTPFQQVVLGLGALAYWPLNESSGTTAYDVVGGHNGTYQGGYSLQDSGPTNAIFGANSSAAFFDGVTGIVDIPEGPFNITNAVTIVAWVNLLVLPTHFTDVLAHGDSSWRLSVNQNATPQPGGNDGAQLPDATGVAGITTGNWHMLAYTYNGIPSTNNNGILYVDGVAVGANAVTTVPPGNNLDVWIGGAPDYGTGGNGRLITADIAHCAVFAQNLNAAQILGIYTGSYTAPVTLTIKQVGTNVVLTWPSGTLLSSPTVKGPWTTNTTATSPFTNSATTGNKFYKVLVQ